MPTILGANTADDSYEISNSVRYNDGDSPEISSTPSSASNRRTWTWSCWVKRANTGVIFNTFCVGPDNTNDGQIYFNGSDQLLFYGRTSSSTKANFTTNTLSVFHRKFFYSLFRIKGDFNVGRSCKGIYRFQKLNHRKLPKARNETAPS